MYSYIWYMFNILFIYYTFSFLQSLVHCIHMHEDIVLIVHVVGFVFRMSTIYLLIHIHVIYLYFVHTSAAWTVSRILFLCYKEESKLWFEIQLALNLFCLDQGMITTYFCDVIFLFNDQSRQNVNSCFSLWCKCEYMFCNFQHVKCLFFYRHCLI